VKFLGSAIDYLLGGAKVGGASEARLRRWLALPGPDLVLPHGRARYVVAEVETSGPGGRRDRLISIGAVAVARMQVDLADCFTTVLRQERASADANILVHGIGGQAQLAGVEPALGMLDFLDYLGMAPLVAFRADVARTVVERAMKSILGVPFRHPWIDLAALLPALFPQAGCATREDWLDRFGLAAASWHDATADAFVAAQLLQVALDAASRAGIVNARQLIDLQNGPAPFAAQ
jgi:DNA polymerase-3 subunit epsilon